VQDQLPRPYFLGSYLGPPDDIRDFKPFDVVDFSAAFAYEMMMALDVTFKARGGTSQSHFPHQAGSHQGMQAIVNAGAGSPRVIPIHGPQDLFGGGVRGVPLEIVENDIALRSATQASRAERIDDRLASGAQHYLRICLIKDNVKRNSVAV
jgi:hypothetical protein